MSDWTWSQSGRAGKIATVLGPDKVLLESFTASERFNEPFEIAVDVLVEDHTQDFIPHLGTGVSLSVDGNEFVKRYFHGVLFDATFVDVDGPAGRFRLTLRPWMSLLDLGRNTRVFQKMAVKDIIESVIKKAGFTDYKIDVSKRATHPREYCVQFRESDFSFISRLMEEEGLLYYFKHSENSHTLVISDDPAGQPKFDPEVEVYFGGRTEHGGPHLWTFGTAVRPPLNKVTLWDAHFRQPGKSLTATDSDNSESPADKAEFYDYPGGFGYYNDAGSEPGDTYVSSRLLASRTMRTTYGGEGDVFAIPVGEVVGVMEGSETTQLLVIEAVHRFSGQDYVGGSSQGDKPDVTEIRFTAIKSDQDWRPARKTPKPLAGGPQTALVVGAAGETIEVDEYARVHIQFFWDREGKLDSNSSCWVRVSQSFADKNFGHMHIPRIGEEVIVSFLDGDPDRPIITGRVYNSDQTPPYKLPDEKTKWVWKSQTVGDGGGGYDGAEQPPPTGKNTGYNELTFEDKGGSEELLIHAQRNWNSWIRLDESRKTGRDTAVRVGRNRQTAVQKNETLTVETGDETRTIQQGSRKTTIQKADDLTLNTGDYSMTVSAGQATVSAMQKITLKVGNNQIVISPTGIEISGLTVKITADTTLSVEGLTSDFKADTMMTISGVMVQIN